MISASQAWETDQQKQLPGGQTVLLVEDEDVFARAVAKRLIKAGYQCDMAKTLAEARVHLTRFQPDLVLLDMRLPDGSGMDLLAELTGCATPVIVLTAYGDISDAVSAMKQGAHDYLKKPIDLDELLLTVEKVQSAAVIKNRLDFSQERDQHRAEGIEMLGECAALKAVRAQITRIARLSEKAESIPPTVLITGETGTGKDVAARLLHQMGGAAHRPFIHVDCASLPAELIESELFGHEKGAFTSAQSARCGLIEAAEDGTLFLDELGELPLLLQAKLLNVLERRMVRRIGATRERPVAARFIAATNRDLHDMVLTNRFRTDLFYRLHVLTLHMPSLRERGDDILLLARHFLAQTVKKYGLSARVSFSDEAVRAMRAYHWPGNVRELKHLVDRAALLAQGETISAAGMAIRGESAEMPEPAVTMDGLTITAAERLLIEEALEKTNGNVSEAARRLGVTRMAMRYRIEKHGIKI